MKFIVLDRLSHSGDRHNSAKNDDAFGFDERVAIVADGATGLWDSRLTDHAVTDARWIADLSVETMLAGRADDPVRDLALEAINRARGTVFSNYAVDGIPRYAWPATSFIMARLQKGLMEISGLGDCVAYVEMDDGFVERFSALGESSDQEAESARRDLASVSISERAENSPGQNLRAPQVLASLRAKRARNNTAESGVWSISLEPEAAAHTMSIALPLGSVRRVLLASDGYSAAFERYGITTPEAFFAEYRRGKLCDLQQELRRIERDDDPLCERFPRYKQSDDSTAILLEIGK